MGGLSSPRAGFTCSLVLLGLLAASSARADELGGVRYQAPKGWQTTDRGQARVFTPRDLGKDQVLAMVLTPATAASPEPAAEQFKAFVTLANEGTTSATELGAAASSDVPAGQLTLQGFAVTDGDLGAHHRLYLMLLDGDQRAFVVIVIKPEALTAKYEDTIMAFVGSLALARTGPATPPSPPPGTQGKIPTGDTPDAFPGTSEWRPSGRGVPIPKAAIVRGKPQGLWWKPVIGQGGRLTATVHLYLPDGTRASRPRPGGPELWDVEGQRKQNGTTGVGTWTLEGGELREAYDGFTANGPYTSGSDKEGAFFKIGGAIFRPLAPAGASIVGTWKTANGSYVFRPDGTFESGHVLTGELSGGVGNRGTWVSDGYLLWIRPNEAPGWITTFGVTGLGKFAIMGSQLYEKQ